MICDRRADAPIEPPCQLVAIVDAAIPKKLRAKDGSHPARRTFQALRIAVNDELEPLEPALDDLAGLLNPGGRLCVIAFHSLEDRIVKNAFRSAWPTPAPAPSTFPVCVCGKKPVVRAGDAQAHHGRPRPSWPKIPAPAAPVCAWWKSSDFFLGGNP